MKCRIKIIINLSNRSSVTQSNFSSLTSSMAVPGKIRDMPPPPPPANHREPTYLLPPKPKPGPLDPLGPLAQVDFLSDFRAPQEVSGLRRTNEGPVGRISPRKTNQGPTRQIRVRRTNDESMPRRTNQDPRKIPISASSFLSFIIILF